jgi:hypothetical protein
MVVVDVAPLEDKVPATLRGVLKTTVADKWHITGLGEDLAKAADSAMATLPDVSASVRTPIRSLRRIFPPSFVDTSPMTVDDRRRAGTR